METQIPENDVPLIVDLDGTLIKTDLLYEGFKALIRKNIFYFFSCCFWLLRGRVNLKKEIFKKIYIPADSLPFNAEVVNFLEKEFDNGRTIILATASLLPNGVEISKVYPLFTKVYGTENINLKGKNKLKLLIHLFGKGQFDYIGNSYSDLVIFASSRYAYLVNPSPFLEKQANKFSNVKLTWRS